MIRVRYEIRCRGRSGLYDLIDRETGRKVETLVNRDLAREALMFANAKARAEGWQPSLSSQ